jgi:hypothetical protein
MLANVFTISMLRIHPCYLAAARQPLQYDCGPLYPERRGSISGLTVGPRGCKNSLRRGHLGTTSSQKIDYINFINS